MSQIFRIVDNTGKLVGFTFDDELIELNANARNEPAALRQVANEIMGRLLNSSPTSLCPHNDLPHECEDCMRESDFQNDIAQEQRAHGRY